MELVHAARGRAQARSWVVVGADSVQAEVREGIAFALIAEKRFHMSRECLAQICIAPIVT